ncbi:hypothetical protein D3C81_1940290 [compost metagenome]
MVIGIAGFPGVIDQAARLDAFAARADVDIVAYRVHRNDAVGLTIFRAQHHARTDSVDR